MTDIQSVFNFIVELEKLKAVHRKTKPIGLERFENSAEHTWHVCMMAMFLKPHANDDINIDRVIHMLLIHDIGEIDVGDVIIYESEKPELKAAEAEGVRRILGLLPDSVDKAAWMDMWFEFEAGETDDAKFAKSIDRIPALLQNLRGETSSWDTHGISLEQVLGVNSRIDQGCSDVWAELEPEIRAKFER